MLRLDLALQLLAHSGQQAPAGEPGSPAWLQELIDALVELSSRDALTGLSNRRSFELALGREIDRVARSGEPALLLTLDIDHFKRVNDSHGHAAGDSVLTVVAERLMRHARDEDTVCRNGGDEFLYLLINPADRQNVARIAGLVRQAIESPIGLGELQFVITPSIGIALYPSDGTNGQTLIAHADAAMYRAKQLQSPCEFFAPPLALGADSPPQPR